MEVETLLGGKKDRAGREAAGNGPDGCSVKVSQLSDNGSSEKWKPSNYNIRENRPEKSFL